MDLGNFRRFVKTQTNKPSVRGKLISALVAALFVILAAHYLPAAEKYPSPRGAVNDFAKVIDKDNFQRMEALAREVLQKTGAALVVATVPTIGDNEEINLYANGLYQAWGIGKKDEDKGLLIVLAVQERKIRIETGYGLEGVLPDGLIGEILDKYVVPHFKEGNYGVGLFNAMYASAAYIAKDAGVSIDGFALSSRQKARPEQKGISIFGLVIFFIAAVLLLGTKTGRSMLPWILLLLVSSSGRGSGSGGFSGGFGGFGGGGSGGGGAGRSF